MTARTFFLYPFSLLYGFILSVRNKLYDAGIFKSESFDIPVISVGNLSMGGTGKTPQIEYLICLLQNDYKVATLSRGYGRKTKGFIAAQASSTAQTIGDEPRQYVENFPNVKVFVGEDRAGAIKRIISENPEIEVILLDDAFQHRKVNPGLNILLTDYRKLFYNDYVVPSGTLREFRSGYKRADVIVVTKSPVVISPIDTRIIVDDINPHHQQRVFFSKIIFDDMKLMSGIEYEKEISKIYTILLFAGIANPYPLEEHLKRNCDELETVFYKDHHEYSIKDMQHIRETFHNIASRNKIIVTTQKDAMRIEGTELVDVIKDLPVFYIPISVAFFGEEKIKFNSIIENYVRENKRNHSVYSG